MRKSQGFYWRKKFDARKVALHAGQRIVLYRHYVQIAAPQISPPVAAVIGYGRDLIVPFPNIKVRYRVDLIACRQSRHRIEAAVCLPRKPVPVFSRHFDHETEIGWRNLRMQQVACPDCDPDLNQMTLLKGEPRLGNANPPR